MKFYDHLIECHQEVSYKRNKKKKKRKKLTLHSSLGKPFLLRLSRRHLAPHGKELKSRSVNRTQLADRVVIVVISRFIMS